MAALVNSPYSHTLMGKVGLKLFTQRMHAFEHSLQREPLLKVCCPSVIRYTNVPRNLMPLRQFGINASVAPPGKKIQMRAITQRHYKGHHRTGDCRLPLLMRVYSAASSLTLAQRLPSRAPSWSWIFRTGMVWPVFLQKSSYSR